jgi:hypothetical protein
MAGHEMSDAQAPRPVALVTAAFVCLVGAAMVYRSAK